MKFKANISTASLGFFLALSLGNSVSAFATTKLATTAENSLKTETLPTLLAGRRRFGFPPAGLTAPRGRRIGARRGDGACFVPGTKLVPVVPPDSDSMAAEKENYTYGGSIWQTTMAFPEFFVQVPEIKPDSKATYEAEFALLDEEGNLVYDMMLALPEEAGIVSVSIPQDDPDFSGLEVGKPYFWEMTVICDPAEPQNPMVRSWVQRVAVSPEFAAQIEAAVPQDIPALYVEAEAWYDTVASLIGLYQENPEDPTVAQNWTDLLNSVGQDAIDEMPSPSEEAAIDDVDNEGDLSTN